MTTDFDYGNTTIDRVLFKAPVADPLAARQWMERALQGKTLHPARLPHSAILFVRSLCCRLPAQCSGGRQTSADSLEHSANRELDRLTAAARRPAIEPVGAASEAVIFMDHAEMLACMARDWLSGALPSNWWWRTLIKRRGADAAVYHAWIETPEFVPAAIGCLAVSNAAVLFAARLPEPVVASLTSRVFAAFAIPSVAAAEAFHPRKEQHAGSSDPARRQTSYLLPATRTVTSAQETETEGPWLPEVAEASRPSLTVIRRIFLAQTLMLRRAPLRARSISFQRALRGWQERRERVRVLSDESQSDTDAEAPIVAPVPSVPSSVDEIVAPSPEVSSVVDGLAIEGETPAEPRPEGTEAIERPLVRENTPERSAAPATAAAPAIPVAAPLAGVAKKTAESGARPSSPASTAALQPAAAGRAVRVPTAFGGLFFLLNVALHLELYADFTAPRGHNLDLSPWDFLCLLGLRFIGDAFRLDPVFDLLADLAGRMREDPPGAGFQPPAWLDAFPEDLMLREEVDEDRWLDRMAAYIRARLVAAMGRPDAVELLCGVHAGVECTATHVDVFYQLESYPIEIRMAGLDRNPGWIAAAGRYVRYHFEAFPR